MPHLVFRFALLAGALGTVLATEPNPATNRATTDYVPDVAALATPASSELRELVERFSADRREIERFYEVPGSATDTARLREFYQAWLSKLYAVDFEKLGVEGRIDATLMRTRLEHEMRLLDRDTARTKEMAALVPFTETIAQLQDARRLLKPVDARNAAAALAGMKKSLEKARASLEKRPSAKDAKDETDAESPKDAAAAPSEKVERITVSKVIALRAANRAGELQQSLREWFRFYDGYDPVFGWWARQPHQELTSALSNGIAGDAVGNFRRNWRGTKFSDATMQIILSALPISQC